MLRSSRYWSCRFPKYLSWQCSEDTHWVRLFHYINCLRLTEMVKENLFLFALTDEVHKEKYFLCYKLTLSQQKIYKVEASLFFIPKRRCKKQPSVFSCKLYGNLKMNMLLKNCWKHLCHWEWEWRKKKKPFFNGSPLKFILLQFYWLKIQLSNKWGNRLLLYFVFSISCYCGIRHLHTYTRP